ncbi:MAG: S41 family peptidase [Gemmataceae bacterium]
MSRRNLFWILAIASLSFLGLAVSYSAPTREKDHDYELVKLLVDVLTEVRQNYVVEISPERERQLVEEMINGGLERLDPHSMYINPSEYKTFSRQSEGKFGGIGIQVGYDRSNPSRLSVLSPLVGTPAYEAGIQAGDLILKIDGRDTESLRMNEAIDLIQGRPGTKVTLTIQREGQKEPRDYEIERTLIKVPSVLGDRRSEADPKEWDWFIDKKADIAYLRITSFTATTTAEMRERLTQLERDGVRGLIIDLRNNPGGLLKSAIEVSDFFLGEGIIVSTKGRNHRDEVYRARPDNCLLSTPGQEVPIAILVNRGSASASEIFAAALQDHGRAVVIGERTYGKGSVQNIILMENDTSALKLTTASYWRPSGKNIHRYPNPADFAAAKVDPDEWGVRPNKGYEIKLSDEERLAYLTDRYDRDLIRVKPKPEDNGKKPFEDRILNKALEYLRGKLAKQPMPPRDT